MLIPISQIAEPYIILRVVDQQSLEYLELRDSLARVGQVNSICVRPYKGGYQVVDGFYRYTAGKELNFTELDCTVREFTDEEVLLIQIHANVIGMETKPIEYARRLRRLMKNKPEMTFSELATMVCKGTQWVKQILNLLDLPPATQDAIERGQIPLTSAHLLARMASPALRREYTELAKVLPAAEFKVAAEEALKHFQECVRQGKLVEHFTDDFVPQAFVRNLRVLQTELNEGINVGRILAAERCETVEDGWNAALRWTLNLDLMSVESQREAFEKRQKRNFKALSNPNPEQSEDQTST